MAVFPFAGFVGGLVSGRLPGLFAAILGTSLDSPAPFRYPLWLAAVLYVPGLLALLATRGEGAASEPANSGGAARAPLGFIVVFGVVALLRMTATGVVQSFFNVYLDSELHLAPATVGMLMATGQLWGGIAALCAPILMARSGKRRTYVTSSLWNAVSYLPLALIPHWAAAGTGFLGITAMGSIAQPTANVFGQEAVEPRWRTAVSSASVMAMGLGYSIAGLGGGQAVAAVGYRTVFLIAGVLPAAGALVFWAYFRAPRMAPVHGRAPDLAE
jgi:predicted MFS family arabinose efflux permease